MNSTAVDDARINFDDPKYVRRRKIRALKDKAASVSIGLGGVSVIIAILLIFVYLLSEVLPMFKGASMEQKAQYGMPAAGSGSSLLLAMEEQAEIALRITDQGSAVFFRVADGQLVDQVDLALPDNTKIVSFAQDSPVNRLLAYGLDNGQVLVFRHRYKITYPDDRRVITPVIEYPYGEQPLDLGEAPLTQLSIRDGEDALLIAGSDASGQLFVTRFNKEEDFLTEEIVLEPEVISLPVAGEAVRSLAIDEGQSWIYSLIDDNRLNIYRLHRQADPEFHSQIKLTEVAGVSDLTFLLGGISLLAGDQSGYISQWFLVRTDADWELQKVRTFAAGDSPVTHIKPEHRRKGFIAIDRQGELSIFNTTAQRTLLTQKVSAGPVTQMAVAPRANALILEDERGQVQVWLIDNEHPEVSWSALWDKVWYESYEKPKYVWQSSASNNDFEPKLSLMPLAFGTIKAAFYAMLLAAPLAICGAIFTAHFMAPAMRRKVKPLIELMEALPTVILGFLAGLWLAPFMETHLPGVFSLLLLTPLAILLMSFIWFHLPRHVRALLPEGWQAALLIPVILLVAWLSILCSSPLENAFFGGDMRSWLSNEAGISFDQRNALVVGLAMGFAVIPTIFSITEDAIFSVPKHLTNGSLALGATQWQTLTRVVLLTASPGIFSAVMIGFGRAVGETMIVLMATGNTPIMDWNIFEGMRTLAANIAVEMPESEVGSTHYRILFLAALVLFLFTFVFNTFAEVVRQRLRKRYGSL